MTDRELMQQALEALEEPREHIFRHRRLEAITALRERLAQPEHEWLRGECVKCGQSMEQPEQEPVAWTGVDFAIDCTPPRREWVGLTQSEIAEILCDDRWQGRPEYMLLQMQAKLKEKNSAQ